ncbi:hypothetical protein B0H12DRAFT_1040306, partial [Mycena haematopus]
RATTITYCIGLNGDGCAGNTCTTITSAPGCVVIPESVCFFTSANVNLCRGTSCNDLCVTSKPCSLPTNGGACVWPETQSIEVLS